VHTHATRNRVLEGGAMLTIRFDPDRLSTEELANLACVLHNRCTECIEHDVLAPCQHYSEVHSFLATLACAIDDTLRTRARTATAEALAIDDSTGEWLAGS
jgi:hypothetical protein